MLVVMQRPLPLLSSPPYMSACMALIPPPCCAAYAAPIKLSQVDFLGDDGDKWIGWGAMPDSVKKLYNRKGR